MRIDGGGGGCSRRQSRLTPLPSKDERMKIENESIARYVVSHIRPLRWLVSELVWADWYWFIVRGKHYWLAGLGWLKPTSEQADIQYCIYYYTHILAGRFIG